MRGDAAGAERPEFDDASWRTVDLPHDWSVEELPAARQESDGSAALWTTEGLPTRVGPFDTLLSAGGRDTGWFVGGTGWYRKRFSAMELPADSLLEILFDGVYMNSDVWLNGAHLGNHPYGYTAFAYDLTPHLRRTGANVLAVRVRNEGRNSRWYSGSGIYRHVWLNATGSVRVPLWGVYVVTPEVSASEAAVRVAVPIENHGAAAADVAVRVRLLDPAGAQAASEQATRAVAGGGTAQAEFPFHLTNPELWSLSTPRLYRVEVELAAGGKVSDRVETPFGIRKIDVDAARGLRINGEPVKLKGGCMHHDNGLLGAAAIDRAEERRIELMKAHGFNAIRTAHNPPSPAFLDACDRLGMLVMDEAFDCWERQKKRAGLPRLLRRVVAQRDLDAMVLRDRNHPSVIFWSIGNEIPERYEPRGVEIGQATRRSHPRPGPDAPHHGWREWRAARRGPRPAFQHLDVAGYNYLWGKLRAGPRAPSAARHRGDRVLPQHAHPQLAAG